MSDRRPPRRDMVFDPTFVNDLRFWVQTDQRVALRVLALVDAVMRDPFDGIGKPERLNYGRQATWSRRITQEHRLMYYVEDDRVTFLQARYHYER